MTPIIGNVGLTSENASLLFGLDVDTVFFDSSFLTVKTGVNNTNDTDGKLERVENAQPTTDVLGELGAMPLPGKIIGIIWQLIVNVSTRTFTFNIKNNDVEVASSVLFVPGSTTGWLKSETLSIPFVEGDQLAINRVRSGSDVQLQKGVFAVCVKWD